jgi:hypothetical protein
MHAIENTNSRLGFEAFTPVYPPRNIDGDRGKVVLNILKIKEANLIFFDVTPSVSSDGVVVSYNAGVMIEMGLFLAEENLDISLGGPWRGRSPRPRAYFYCERSFPRGRLTPIVNEYSIIDYSNTQASQASFIGSLEGILNNHLREKVDFEPPTFRDRGAFELSGTSSSQGTT